MSTSFLQNRRNFSNAASLLSTTTTNLQKSRFNRGFQKYQPVFPEHLCKHHVDIKLENHEKFFETDLTLKLNQAFQTSPQIDTPKAKSIDLQHIVLDNVLAKGDFNVYQGNNLYDFFALDTEPKQVSQVCLVNDHFMLVKMPESCWRRTSQIESILEENETDDDLQAAETRKESRSQSGSSAAKYFRCKRNCKISPIHQDSADIATAPVVKPNGVSNIFSKTSIETDNKEVFSTITTIKSRGFKSSYAKNAKKNDNGEQTNNHSKDNNVPIEEMDIFSRNAHVATSNSITTQTTLRRDNHFNSSMRESIEISPRGTLVTPDITTLNGNIAAYYPHGAEQLDRKDSKKNHLKTQGNFNAIRWILRAFRSRVPKKPKSKIHAVVYKTYFVRWNKPSSLAKNYDSRQGLHVVEVTPKLRRSQSACF